MEDIWKYYTIDQQVKIEKFTKNVMEQLSGKILLEKLQKKLKAEERSAIRKLIAMPYKLTTKG